MIEAHLKKLRIRDDVSPEEESAIRALVSEVREYRPDKVVIRRGQELNESILLLDGWMARTKDLSDGGRAAEREYPSEQRAQEGDTHHHPMQKATWIRTATR